MSEPIGSLCVLPDESHAHWLVSICQGGGRKLVLRRFESRDKAADWAIEERARRRKNASLDDAANSLVIHFPDDCPCSGSGSTW
jgi:hypothetical protein